MLAILASHGPADLLTQLSAYPLLVLICAPSGILVLSKARGAGMARQRWVLGLLAMLALMPAVTLGAGLVYHPFVIPILMLVALLWSMPTVALLVSAKSEASRGQRGALVFAAAVGALGACALAVWVNSWWSNDNDMTAASALYTAGALILPWFVFVYALIQLRTTTSSVG